MLLTGEHFLQEGLINAEQFEQAMVLQRELEGKEPIAKILVKLGFISERDRVRCLGKVWGVPFADVTEVTPQEEAIHLISPQNARRFKALPMERQGNRLLVAMVNPLDIFAIDEIRLTTGLEVEPLIAIEDDVNAVLNQFFRGESEVLAGVMKDFDGTNVELHEKSDNEDAADEADEAPIIRLANLIISQAVIDKASDIHIEPQKECVRVRYRIDGVLSDGMQLPKKVNMPLTSRFKIISNMDIAEKRVPQDNRISMTVSGKDYDFRVSTLPTVYGEKIVMRVLDKGGINVGLNKLGFLEHNLMLLEDMCSRTYGIILVTGPTGSGKSTTLYSVLNQINTGDNNIITIEDPVEYELSGINQCGVNVRAGMTFAAGLRAMLRQDPDVIMVGEMRDTETATIAMEAALTGHLVLSTLHTNDAPSAPTRLMDMGVEPFLISSSIIGILAQRLVRVSCANCKEPYQVPKKDLMRYGFQLPQTMIDDPSELVTLYRGTGCDKCKKSGFKGRTGIHELLVLTDDLRDMILKEAPAHLLRQEAVKNGMKVLQDDALAKVLLGVTTLDEVVRVIYA
ncbi:MAG: Flp pilus assembly complex ATPase component TadA [Fimbriimonadaceae bacterium]|jgi:type IV pilus assembly protein PilB|nr:Flp pilus assembly complex ATPase component TadA [Fimbriimonadaceae bacterium]